MGFKNISRSLNTFPINKNYKIKKRKVISVRTLIFIDAFQLDFRFRLIKRISVHLAASIGLGSRARSSLSGIATPPKHRSFHELLLLPIFFINESLSENSHFFWTIIPCWKLGPRLVISHLSSVPREVLIAAQAAPQRALSSKRVFPIIVLVHHEENHVINFVDFLLDKVEPALCFLLVSEFLKQQREFFIELLKFHELLDFPLHLLKP